MYGSRRLGVKTYSIYGLIGILTQGAIFTIVPFILLYSGLFRRFSDLEWMIIVFLSSIFLSFGAGEIAKGTMFIIFIKQSSENDLLENRYVLVIALLGSGMFFMPLMLKGTYAYQNEPNPKRYSARFTLARWMSLSTLTSGLVGMGSLLIWSLEFFHSADFTNLYFYSLLLSDQDKIVATVFGYMTIPTYSFLGIIGLMSAPAFYQKNALEIYSDNEGFMAKYQRFWGYTFALWGTLLLLFQLFSALFEIFYSFLGFLDKGKYAWITWIFTLMIVPIIIAWQGFIIYTCVKTIGGIWSKDDTVRYKTFNYLHNKLLKNKPTGETANTVID